MTDTTHLALPLIDQNQSQKHVTHNEALRALDAIVHLSVLDDSLSAPPGSPADGDRYIVAASPTDAWTGKAGYIAAWQDGAWMFYAPQKGWRCYIATRTSVYVYDGAAWASIVSELQNLEMLGVGTTADASNPFSARVNASLWTAKYVADGGDGNLRYAMNKETAAKTVSFTFQSNWSARAELGLTGDDDFHVKVSPDGSIWHEAINIERSTGRVSHAEHPKFSAYVNYDKYIAANTWTGMSMNNARHNDHGDFNASNGKFTAPHAGYYLFGVGYRFKANATVPDDIRVGLSINSAAPNLDTIATCGDAAIVTLQSFATVTALLKLAAGDTVEPVAYMTTNDGYVEANSNFFWGCQIA